MDKWNLGREEFMALLRIVGVTHASPIADDHFGLILIIKADSAYAKLSI